MLVDVGRSNISTATIEFNKVEYEISVERVAKHPPYYFINNKKLFFAHFF